ncbi:conserved hypothetical protein [Neospora caninum Liverpool]|uniref:Transmembrane protein n=1 Tax=Neospora caninum (strain Liverpool) TaxID=572307 RepID=F0VQC9_NEOCL|nr:conserved hypothetical protein [Neospora caninum Liverpool]CBZ55926.1 conserved hypothetical protein [Neospora caninum Liverpool]CEL70669.1 TPA: hypothetical protein BN1204_063520 [Neospora caninum Liverpool]|eukprot:XP_003885952.1 conserved hypothetical protein [Neospora caninum Liverpool]
MSTKFDKNEQYCSPEATRSGAARHGSGDSLEDVLDDTVTTMASADTLYRFSPPSSLPSSSSFHASAFAPSNSPGSSSSLTPASADRETQPVEVIYKTGSCGKAAAVPGSREIRTAEAHAITTQTSALSSASTGPSTSKPASERAMSDDDRLHAAVAPALESEGTPGGRGSPASLDSRAERRMQPAVFGSPSSSTSGLESQSLLAKPGEGSRRSSHDSDAGDDSELSPFVGGDARHSVCAYQKTRAVIDMHAVRGEQEKRRAGTAYSSDEEFDSDEETFASRRDGSSLRDVSSRGSMRSMAREEEPRRNLWAVTKGIHDAIMRRLVVIFSFVAVVSCWELTDVWVAVLTEEESISELIYYGGMLVISVGMTVAVQLFKNPSNSFVFVLSAIFSFFAAVGGWGFLSAVVYFAAGESVVLLIFYFFCFFAVAVAFIICYIWFFDPDYTVDIIGSVF